MFKKISITCMLITLTGCAMTQQPSFTQARPVTEKVVYLEPPISNSQFQLTHDNDPALEKVFNRYIRTGKAENIVTEGFVQFAYNGNQQPIVVTNPLQITVISLEAGEHFTNVTTGDPSRWSYSAAVSGYKSSQQFNILVKPSMPGIATNMVITTDRRIYNLKLVSADNGRLTRNVSFWYPDEIVSAINQETLNNSEESAVAQVPDVNLSNLNFNYQIANANGFFKSLPTWSPTRVFDDGVHTYIEFPKSMTNRDMPVLLVENHGNQELVNYRSKQPYFVVDKIFKQAVLVIGISQSQTKVIITNKNYS